MACKACRHEEILTNNEYNTDEEIIDDLGHVCNEENCEHSCRNFKDYGGYEVINGWYWRK